MYVFTSCKINNYNKSFLKKKSNKNVILLPDYNTFLINSSIKTKTNHHLTTALNDDLNNKNIIKNILDDIIDEVIIKNQVKNVIDDLTNNVLDNFLGSVCIKNEVEIILDDLISDIEKNQEYINYINSINEDDFDNCNNTGIPLKSFLSVGYYLVHNYE